MKENAPIPYPGGPGWKRHIAAEILQPLFDVVSGEITSKKAGVTLGAARTSGRVKDFWISVLHCGDKENDVPLQISGELFINGTSCITTRPSIEALSGETATHKTTKVSGDTGVTQAVINRTSDVDMFTAGDVFTYDLTINRTSPDTEIRNIVVCVELEPIKL